MLNMRATNAVGSCPLHTLVALTFASFITSIFILLQVSEQRSSLTQLAIYIYENVPRDHIIALDFSPYRYKTLDVSL